MIYEITPAMHYIAAMDSVNLINDLKSKEVLTDYEVLRMKANKDHLIIMLKKDYWTDEDLTPFEDAIND